MRRLLGPGLMTVVMLAVLLGLGTWQVRRLHWKEAILARIAQAEAAPPIPLPAAPQPYTKVAVTGYLRADLSAQYGVAVRDTPAGPQLGTFLVQPLERPGEPPLLVERGWVPQQRAAPIAQPSGQTTIAGYIHGPESPGLFSARDDPAERIFYTLDPAAIGASLELPHVAPYILVALGPAPPELWPDPAKHLPRPPNNHLAYAVTWYGLALALVVIFLVWARGTLRA
ncbi:MAG TPA: SURF1 family cytochrome oxidase biogenesis protein [Acetobacteraceae bacterium]|nr:SURF1 family cytochrome oxidase biogenesis protein [Acetobacteraceae bacterium]